MNGRERASYSVDPAAGLRLVPVSREIAERLKIYCDLLQRWQTVTNLVSDTAALTIWSRHFADCAQVHLIAPSARRWIDIGSGAGFPGLVLAMQLADVDGAIVHCIEKDKRKCAFLREVARETGSPAVIHPVRVQTIVPALLGFVDAVTARAFAPLPTTVRLSKTWLEQGAVGIFPCGRGVDGQQSTLSSSWTSEIVPSVVVDSKAVILRIRVD